MNGVSVPNISNYVLNRLIKVLHVLTEQFILLQRNVLFILNNYFKPRDLSYRHRFGYMEHNWWIDWIQFINQSLLLYVFFIYLFNCSECLGIPIPLEGDCQSVKSDLKIINGEYSVSQEICTRFLLCCALLWLYIDWFSHIHQAYFIGPVAI